MAGARLLGALLTYAFGFDVDGFEGRDLVQADVTGTVSNVTIEPFTFGGCFSADLSAGALGFNYTTSIASSPSDCAVVCAAHEAFLVGQGACYCVEPSTFALGAWQQLEEVSCDAPCDRWSSLDFGSLTAYFQTLPGFCGSSTEGIFSYYETWTAVSAVGQGVLDRARALWWQVVMVQSLMSSSEHRDLFQEGTWLWRLHASSASTGRAAFPLHRDLDESILGLLMDEEPAMPMIMGTSYTGSLYAVPAGTRSPAQLVVAGASFPGHTVDGTSVQPGAAPVASFDQNRRTLFAAQPIGFGNSSLYALELDAPNELAYRHLRFIPFCNSSWCAVNELRFRYQELEIDMSSTLTYFMHDLTDPLLRHGAILIDFPAAVFIDEFSFSMPYNTTASAPTRWILQGSNDRVRRCSLTGAPSYQAMKDGTYVQMAGETFQGRTVYRDAAGAIIYWDQATLSWWVSPRIHEGGYGAIRCVGDAADPHLLSPASCVAWNGQLWDIAPNVSFSCRGNEWVVLHQQSRPYPLPDVPSAPLRWFKVSRVGVDWTLLIEDIPGLVGQLLSDLDDGYVAAGVTVGGESMLKTLGQIGGDKSQDRCSVSLRVNLSFVEGSDPGHAVDCAATAYGIGGWLWPDSQGSGKLWLTCANDTEFQADNWVQRYAEATADADFSFSGGLEKSPDAHVLKAQLVRILELAVAPTLLSGLSLSGPVNYFVCPTGTNCTFSPDLEVRIIKGGASCGCGEQVLTIETHGFYKACYCLTELMVAAAGSCSADADFTSLAGIVLGAGPEPARLARMEMALGSSWQPGITGFTSHTSIYQGMLQYALGADLSVSFPSLVAITNASEPVCGFNPSACDLVGEVFCALGEPCLARLNGTSMRSFNGLAVVRKDDTCSFALEHLAAFEGLSNPKVGCSRSDGHKASYRPVHTWDLGQPTRGATDVGVDEPGPGVYRLCWSYDPTNSTPGEEYPLDAGYLMMLGPLAMDFECFLNFPCVINISGIGLAASNKVLLVESSAGRCGDSNLPALDGRWNFSNPAAAGQDLFGSYNLYSFGLTKGKSGASHRICWAHDPTGSESSDFKVEIDPDFLWIRLTAIVDCVPGRTCSVAVLGSGILPSSQVLIIAKSGRCGSASALEIPGLANPASPASTNGTSGMYVFGSAASTPLGFRICWGSAPSGEAAGFPVELQYPMYYEATVFATQVGAVNLALMDSERGGRHRALALFADPSETPSTSNALTGSPAHWADFGTSAGHAAGAVLHIDGADRALPAVGYVFHQRPSDGLSAVALTTRRPLVQGIDDCENCDDFTSKHTDYVLVAGFRDISSPEKHPGNLMVLKAQPHGPQSAPTWQARRAAQHFNKMPPEGLDDWEDAYRPCSTTDPNAACAYTSREQVRFQKVARLSPTRLLAAFADGEAQQGTVVVVTVSHHFPDQWSMKLGMKQVVNAGKTSHLALAAVSESVALVTFFDETTASLQARVIQVTGDGLNDVTLGAPETVILGNSTNETANFSTEEGSATSVRVAATALAGKVLVAFGAQGEAGEVVLLTIDGVNATRAAATPLRSQADHVSLVTLGSSALCVFRDPDGLAVVQEVEVFENYNGEDHAIRLGSSAVVSEGVESLVAVGLNGTGVLAAFRDNTGRGVTMLIGTSFA